MFVLFVFLMHIHNIVATHGALLFWVIALRDLSFAGGAFAGAAIQLEKPLAGGASALLNAFRFLVGIAAVVFGLDSFWHPALAPGIPFETITPVWIYGRFFWAYLMGATLIACGVCLVVNQELRPATISLAAVALLLGVFVYSRMIFANPADVDGGFNNLVDILAFAGTAMVLAQALSRRPPRPVS